MSCRRQWGGYQSEGMVLKQEQRFTEHITYMFVDIKTQQQS